MSYPSLEKSSSREYSPARIDVCSNRVHALATVPLADRDCFHRMEAGNGFQRVRGVAYVTSRHRPALSAADKGAKA